MTLYVLRDKTVTSIAPENEYKIAGRLMETDLIYTRLSNPTHRVLANKQYKAYSVDTGGVISDYYFIIDEENRLMKPCLQEPQTQLYKNYWSLEKEDYGWTQTITSGTGVKVTGSLFSTEEKEMQIETNVTLINGKDAINYTQPQLLAFIREIEAQISTYNEIKTESNYINSEIRKCQDNIKELVDILDSI